MKAYIQKVTNPPQSSFIYRIKSVPRFVFGWHFHPEYELTFVERSRGKRYVGDSIEDYESGDLVLLGPNLPHTWYSGPERREHGRHRAFIVHFAKSFVGDGFFDRPELESVAQLLRLSVRGLTFTARTRDEVARRLTAMRRLGRFERLLELLKVLDILARDQHPRTISSESFVPSLHRANQTRIDHVCKFVNEKYTEVISQVEVAELVGMSPQVFSRFFKRTVGRTFVEYLAELRVSHACRLLIESDLSVLEISLRSGFNNLSNFNRRFLRLKGMSPRRYRSHHQTAFAG